MRTASALREEGGAWKKKTVKWKIKNCEAHYRGEGLPFLAGFLQVSSMFMTHILKSLTSPLKVSESLLKTFKKSVSSL